MPLHPITFIWVEQWEHERAMSYQEVERSARLAARRAARSELVIAPVAVSPPGGIRALVERIGRATSAIANLGQHRPGTASS
jgi:hypothetical protein